MPSISPGCVGHLTSSRYATFPPRLVGKFNKCIDHVTSMFPLNLAGRMNRSVWPATSGHVTVIFPLNLFKNLNSCIGLVISISPLTLAGNARTDGRTDGTNFGIGV